MEVSQRMEEVKVDEARALTLAEKDFEQKIWDAYASSRPWIASSPGIEAASIMTRNRIAIAKDIEKRSGGSDHYLGHMGEDAIDEAMRAMVCLLCQDELTFKANIVNHHDVAVLATDLDDRMCVPRDMGSRSAATIKRLTGIVSPSNK